MDPTLPPQNSFEVPSTRPAGDMIPLVPGHQETGPATPEAAPNPLRAPGGQLPPVAPLAPVGQQQTTQMPLPVTPAIQAVSHGTPAVAGDLDLIEKEWVVKAKSIVAQTRTDPYVQNSEMNKFKADYMKKRYNKDIKIEQ